MEEKNRQKIRRTRKLFSMFKWFKGKKQIPKHK